MSTAHNSKEGEIVFIPFTVEAPDTLFTCTKCGATVSDDEEAMDLHREWHRKLNSPFGGAFNPLGSAL